MRRQEDIFGFTLGELSFLLLFSLMVLFTLGEQKNAKNIATQNQLKETKLKLEEAKKRIAQLETENKVAEKNKKDLKSKQTPSCNEIGLKKGFYGEFIIRGADNYSYDDKQFNFNGLTSYISKDLEEAKNQNCILTIKVIFPRKSGHNEEFGIRINASS
ncbi:MAG: hypothetical protein HZC11_09400 [Nitrospirae bacterium]|nr:hypothetical protein [Nitrospirota bacterium]